MFIGTGNTDLSSDLPDLQYPSDSELADSLAPSHPSTSTHASAVESLRIPGPFRVFRTLGEGGFAKAVAAQELATNRVLCLKVFEKDRLKDNFDEGVMLNELEVYKRVASLIPCPAGTFLMGLEFSFQTQNQICFAMDLMAGDLCTYMAHRPQYCSRNASRWSAQIALGIDALHQIGVIHRDFKSENILVDARENVRITDYGLCYVDEEEEPLDRREAYTAGVIGTRYCMAPEIFYHIYNPDDMMYGAPIDWWAVGCVFFQLFAQNHRAPFNTKNDIRQYAYWCSCDGLTSKQHPAFKDFHEPVTDLLSGLLHPDPSLRYGFFEVANHETFLLESGKSEFSDASSRALKRKELPNTLPNLQHNKDIHDTEVWHCLSSCERPRVSDVDWVKPAFFSSS